MLLFNLKNPKIVVIVSIALIKVAFGAYVVRANRACGEARGNVKDFVPGLVIQQMCIGIVITIVDQLLKIFSFAAVPPAAQLLRLRGLRWHFDEVTTQDGCFQLILFLVIFVKLRQLLRSHYRIQQFLQQCFFVVIAQQRSPIISHQFIDIEVAGDIALSFMQDQGVADPPLCESVDDGAGILGGSPLGKHAVHF